MTRERILTEDEDFITTEDGEYIHTESSDMTTGVTGRRAMSRLKPSTFWQKYWYFYDKKGNRRRR